MEDKLFAVSALVLATLSTGCRPAPPPAAPETVSLTPNAPFVVVLGIAQDEAAGFRVVQEGRS